MISPTKSERDILTAFLGRAREELPTVCLISAERIKDFDNRLLIRLQLPNDVNFAEEQAETLHYLAADISIGGEHFLSLSLDDESTDGEKLDTGFLSQGSKSNVLPFLKRFGPGLAISGACAAVLLFVVMTHNLAVQETAT